MEGSNLRKKRKDFLKLRVHELAVEPSLAAVCAGYEDGRWRAEELARHMFDWLPEFALNQRELRAMSQENAVPLLRKAASVVYQTKKTKSRGEIGELLLHICLRQVYGTLPAISKIHFKDGPNETVKGFDAVHVVDNDDVLELWLGEVKFYRKIGSAISSVCSELQDHCQHDYLRNEFAAILNKVEPCWPLADKLEELLDPTVSLDDVFARTCFPVLLTYESKVMADYDRASADFRAAFEKEVRKHHGTFSAKVPAELEVHLFLLPLHFKDALVLAFDKQLRAWQAI